MAVARVQRTGTNSNGSTATQTATLNSVGAGNCLALTISIGTTGSEAVETLTVSDGQGSYTQVVRLVGAAGTCGIEMQRIANTTSGTHTVTVTPSQSCFLSLDFQELSGADTTTPEDGTATGNGTMSAGTNNISTSGNVPVSGAGELIIAGATDNDSPNTYVALGSYTLDDNLPGTNTVQALGTEHHAVSAAETPSIQAQGETAGVAWQMVAASFKPPAGAGAVANQFITLQSVPNAVSY